MHISLLHVGKTARKYLIQECDLQQKRWLEKPWSHAPSLTSLKKLKKLEHLVSSSSLSHLPSCWEKGSDRDWKMADNHLSSRKAHSPTIPYKKPRMVWIGTWIINFFFLPVEKPIWKSTKTRCLSISFCQTYLSIIMNPWHFFLSLTEGKGTFYNMNHSV